MSNKTELRFNTECVKCIINRYLNNVPNDFSPEQKLAYVQLVCKQVAEAPAHAGAPVVTQSIKNALKKNFGISEDFTKEKHYFNQLMLAKESYIYAQIMLSEDILKTAVQYAMTGNYIDFGSMHTVDEEYLEKSLQESAERNVEEAVLKALKNDLLGAKRLVLLTDNCGEIVLDKLLLNVIKELYPQIQITVMVRGGEVLNDATRKDALEVGIDMVATVVDNGTEIAGTFLDAVSKEALQILEEADVILSKGQANFETLRGCGKNIYYIFLCKCDMFANRFGVPRFTGMMINDRDYIRLLEENV